MILTVMAWTACGGGSSSPAPSPIVSPSTGKYLYVVNSLDGTVSSLSVAPTGSLTTMTGSGQSALIQAPTGVAVNTASGKLYVGSSTSRSITTFSIDLKSGQISNPVALSGTILNAPSGVNAENLVVCQSSLFAFGPQEATSRPGQTLWGASVLSFLTDGSIDPTHWSGFGTSSAPPIVSNGYVDSSCRYIFHVDTGANTVSQITYDKSINSSHFYLDYPTGSGPTWVAADLSAKFVFTANSGSNDVSAYTTDLSSGTLTQVSGSPFPAGSQPSSAIVVQNWLYVANAGDSTVSAYAIDQTTGALTAVPGSPFAVGNHPTAFATTITDLAHSPSGMLLYVANQNSNNVSAFTINTSGALSPVAGSPFPAGSAPIGMTVFLGPQ
jgi:6-phosphogluconolactonase (cycloisomerase 2 family)